MDSAGNTPCKDCAFAKYTEDGLTQIGCELGYIDKFKAVGNEVVEAYDQDKEFYVIMNRRCPGFRSQEWANKVPPEKRESFMALENHLPFHVVIFANDDIEKMRATLKSLKAQEQKPTNVTVIRRKFNKLKPKKIEKLLDKHKFAWRIENLFLALPDIRVINGVAKSVGLPYITVLDAGFWLPSDYFSELQKFVITNVNQFAWIKPLDDAKNGWTMPLSVYQYWYLRTADNETIEKNIEDAQCKTSKQIIFSLNEVRQLNQK